MGFTGVLIEGIHSKMAQMNSPAEDVPSLESSPVSNTQDTYKVFMKMMCSFLEQMKSSDRGDFQKTLQVLLSDNEALALPSATFEDSLKKFRELCQLGTDACDLYSCQTMFDCPLDRVPVRESMSLNRLSRLSAMFDKAMQSREVSPSPR